MNKTFPKAYIRKKFVNIKDATVPVQCKALQYGLGCFSGIRGHWKDGQLYLFRMKDHFDRLAEGTKTLDMRLDMTYAKFEKLVLDLIKKNKAKEDLYIRPIVYCASTALTPRFSNSDDDLAIYIISLKEYFNAPNGLNVCVSSWRRVDDDMISSKSKATGSYANSALVKSEAIRNGYDEGLFLTRDGKVCEASGANIFGIKNGAVWTPPLGLNNLNGITRRSLIEIFKNEMGLEVKQEAFDRSMLYAFDEIFLSGTAAKVSFVRSVDKKLVGSGKMGKVTKKVKEIFEKASKGDLPKYEKWLIKVY